MVLNKAEIHLRKWSLEGGGGGYQELACTKLCWNRMQ